MSVPAELPPKRRDLDRKLDKLDDELGEPKRYPAPSPDDLDAARQWVQSEHLRRCRVLRLPNLPKDH